MTLDCLALQDQVDQLILDSSYINIRSIVCGNQLLEYQVEQRHPVYGSKIVIKLPNAAKKNDLLQINIKYTTTDQCTAVQW